MKTSNKLLIALALTLLILPLSILTIIAKDNRIDEKEYHALIKGEETSDLVTSKFIKKYKTTRFKNVTITGSSILNLKIKLITNRNSYFKVTKNLENNLTYKTDKEGNLNIDFKDISDYQNGTLLIFSSELEKMTFNTITITEFNAQQESLNVDVLYSRRFTFGEETIIHNLNLNALGLKASTYSAYVNLELKGSNINNLNANLNLCALKSNGTLFNNIKVEANTSLIEFNGDLLKKNDTIKTLALNISGKSTVNFNNIKIGSATGNLSDETNIQIPMVNLKQILNTK